jgi:predicted dehydrogenase
LWASSFFVDGGSGLGDASARLETVDVVTRCTLQDDLFARAIRGGTPLPFPLEDALSSMRVLDAAFRAGKARLRAQRRRGLVRRQLSGGRPAGVHDDGRDRELPRR